MVKKVKGRRQRMLTEEVTANTLECSVGLLRHWRREQRGPGWIRIKGEVRYPESWLLEFIQEQEEV